MKVVRNLVNEKIVNVYEKTGNPKKSEDDNSVELFLKIKGKQSVEIVINRREPKKRKSLLERMKSLKKIIDYWKSFF